MKTQITFFIFLFLFVSGTASSQNVKLGIEFGAALPQADYGGSTIDFYNGTKYGLKSGVNFGAVVKFSLATFNLRGGIVYHNLSNEGIAQTSNPGGRVEIKNNILSFMLGPELYFPVIGSPIRPYLGANLILSSIGGEVRFQGVSNVPSGTYTVSSATRFGLGISGGTELRMSGIILDIGLRYNFYNLGGKEFITLPSNNRIDSYVNLNDARDPQFNNSTRNFIANDRNIAALQFNLGILFGLR
jgi:hypothetical protein